MTGRAGAFGRSRRLLRPQRMRTAAGATKTHGSGGGFRRFLAFGRISGRNARKRRDRPPLTCVSAIWAALSCVSAIRPALTYVLANRPVRSAEQAGELGTTPSPPLLRCARSARPQATDRGRRQPQADRVCPRRRLTRPMWTKKSPIAPGLTLVGTRAADQGSDQWTTGRERTAQGRSFSSALSLG